MDFIPPVSIRRISDPRFPRFVLRDGSGNYGTGTAWSHNPSEARLYLRESEAMRAGLDVHKKDGATEMFTATIAVTVTKDAWTMEELVAYLKRWGRFVQLKNEEIRTVKVELHWDELEEDQGPSGWASGYESGCIPMIENQRTRSEPMNQVTFPEIRVGEPTKCGALAVYPLYPERSLFPCGILDYLLSHEAQEAGTSTVREVSKEGKVGELLVENNGRLPVLFLEGEELVGAKQNRVMRTSIVVAAGTQVIVPVCCTERGRWGRSSGSLRTGSHASPSLRSILKEGRLKV